MTRIRIALAGLVASVAAIVLLPSPFLWVFLGWAVFFADLAVRGRRPGWRLLGFNLALLLLMLAAAETFFAVRTRREHDAFAAMQAGGGSVGPFVQSDRLHREDPELGTSAIPGARVTASRRHEGRTIYEVTYTLDGDGLRIAPPHDETAGGLLFFGGSYVFGEGVEDDQTLPWLVGVMSGGRHRVYNFGLGGYGPQQMLAALESGRVERVVEGDVEHAFYLWIVNHVGRVAGREPWTRGWPRYRLDGESVRLDGRFGDGAGIEAPGARSWSDRLIGRSALLDAVHGGTLGYADNARLLAAVVAASRDRVQARWPGARFHVIFWDDDLSFKHALMQAAFERAGLSLIHVREMLPGFLGNENSYWLDPADRHPSPATYEQMADFLVRAVIVPGARVEGE